MIHSATLEVQESESLRYDIVLEVNGEDIQMQVMKAEGSADPELLNIQKVLLLMCLQIGNQFNEERNKS
jgi:hypothetical protein